jgi:ADP-heptose:LPS heptosyltransferase
LVVTADTSIAHLAGALGKETFIILPYSADVRWEMERSDSPWYPSVTLFRQPSPGAWKPALEQVAHKIRELVAGAARINS